MQRHESHWLNVTDAEETFDFHKNANGQIERTLKIPILIQSKLQRDLLEELKDKGQDTLTGEEKELIKGLETSEIYACGFYPVQEAQQQPFF